VRAEATLADRNKTLVPCMIESCERPIMLELTHTAELSHWTGDIADAAWRSYIDHVRRFVDADMGEADGPVGGARSPQPHSAFSIETPQERLLAVLAFDNLSGDQSLRR
jgi:hypothetical protein